ncbi:MAG: TetR/AcrR family transcriptional regulator [Proteobacteria bacterium]|nr:TetR/AcrR family transcriptional regulator [Pseudomonadota bacterium]
MSRRPYHHGDLREALVAAAQAAVETSGPEALSLRDLAQSLGVSTAAPYRHFPDRRALLDEVAARGFADLDAAYRAARAGAPNPRAAMRETARAYLNLAFSRPGLFRLMFASDALGVDASPALLAAAGQAWESLYAAARAAEPDADLAAVKRRAITGWSTLHGFITLVQGGRLKGFMTEPLSEAELLEAVLDKSLGEG